MAPKALAFCQWLYQYVMGSILRVSTYFESAAMLMDDTDAEYWQRIYAIDEDKRELRLQESIANQETSLRVLQDMISGDTESAMEFLSRCKH